MSLSKQTLLVANRGEIAVRIFRTAKRLGLRTIAVYSDADADAPHTRAADLAVRIGRAPAAESYLDRDRIIDAALETGATLVHPGYGFLAEDDRFAEACEAAGLIFVGPPADVLRAVGDKAAARSLAERAGVPVLPGYGGDDQSDAALARAADEIGFPVLVKPAGGGGGKGMHVVSSTDELRPALEAARRIARSAFDDDRLILERYIEGPRHIEVQVFGDAHGSVVHLGERDCSLQRRHQKIVEESPAPNLDDSTRRKLHDAAVSFARTAGYRNAGTCEFLVAPDGTFGFIEMNARLQVEHPVTEAVTGLDLVELQLKVALGEKLPPIPPPNGHALEVRIYAEDPDTDFLPRSGQIAYVRWPHDARVDTGIEEGTNVTTYYDPMLAKLIVHAPTRDDVLKALDEALASTCILGVGTNLALLAAIVRDETMQAGRITTDYFERAYAGWHSTRDPESAARLAALAAFGTLPDASGRDPWRTLGPWRGTGHTSARIVLHDELAEYVVGLDADRPEGTAVRSGDHWLVWYAGGSYTFEVGPRQRRLGSLASHLDAPLPGQVLVVNVASGDEVTKGTELVVIEAMKMEHAIKAPADGVVVSVLVASGDQVERGQRLVDFAAAAQ